MRPGIVGTRSWGLPCSLVFGVWCSCHRQLDREPASFPGFAPQRHAPAMRFDDVLHNAQADADSLSLAPQFRTAPVKSFEDALVFLGRNPVAVVFDPKINECCPLTLMLSPGGGEEIRSSLNRFIGRA